MAEPEAIGIISSSKRPSQIKDSTKPHTEAHARLPSPLVGIEVKGLFGLYNHFISLNESHITILHGPNGVGKTAILRLVEAFFDARDERYFTGAFTVLSAIPFDTLTLLFEDGWRLSVSQREDTSNAENHSSSLVFRSLPINGEEKSLSLNPNDVETPRRFYRAGFGLVEDKKQAQAKNQVRELLDSRMPKTSLLYIPADRLQESIFADEYDEDGQGQRQIPAVNECAKSLKTAIYNASLSSNRKAQELDRTYPLRLLESGAEQNDNEELDETELRSRLEALIGRRKALANAGLLAEGEEEETIFHTPLNDVFRRALSLYVKDSETKLALYDDLANRISAFQEILQNRFLNKRMVISADKGFYFVTDSGVELEPEQLSSGEQHQIVLFHRLLFTADARRLFFLMDEPELSLHVEWQERFLQDLQRVVTVTPIDIIIATHSPLVIAEHWEWTVALLGRSPQEIKSTLSTIKPKGKGNDSRRSIVHSFDGRLQ